MNNSLLSRHLASADTANPHCPYENSSTDATEVTDILAFPEQQFSRSSSSSWTEVGDDKERENANSGSEEEAFIGRANESDSDSNFGDGLHNGDDQTRRNMIKLAILAAILLVSAHKFSLWINIEKSLEKSDLSERWELEVELATVKEQLWAEKVRRDQTEKELMKAHERLESDLRDRIVLQEELQRTKILLDKKEHILEEMERKTDAKFIGKEFGLTELYEKAKQRQWLKGNLKETSEWWVPLYWRVVRITFFKEY